MMAGSASYVAVAAVGGALLVGASLLYGRACVMTDRSNTKSTFRGWRSLREMLTVCLCTGAFSATMAYLFTNHTSLPYPVLAAYWVGILPLFIWMRWGRKAFP